MAKVTVVQVIYNTKRFIEPVFSAIFAQTFKDIHVVAVIAGNEDGSKELLMEKFPQVEIVDPGYNIGFARGHNIIFERGDSEFYQLVNPDFVMEPDYVEKIVKAFEDETVGAATGKLYKISDFRLKIEDLRNAKILDTTGVIISRSGRAWDRGQHEEDKGQYDTKRDVDAVSGAGAMYRSAALLATKLPRFKVQGSRVLEPDTLHLEPNFEFFDEDFHSYWEDVDLSWRMANAGWKNVFVPEAVGYHGRGAGSTKRGYVDVVGFVKHHKTLSPRIRKLNYQNHFFMYVKNSPWFYPQFFIREFFMLGYIVLFEIGTLKVIPNIIQLIPKMWKKRHLILKKRTL